MAEVKIPGHEKLNRGGIHNEVRYALNSFLFRIKRKEPPLTALARIRTEIGTDTPTRKAILAFFNEVIKDVECDLAENPANTPIALLEEKINARCC